MYCELFEKDTSELTEEEQEECDTFSQDCNECKELQILQEYLLDTN